MVKFQFEAHPQRTLDLLLFENVKNCGDILGSLLDGSLKPELAFLNASLVASSFPVLAAATKALTSESRDGLKTRTIHSELVYNYAASKHIRESLKKWGIAESTSVVLAAKFDATEEDLEATRNLVQGTEIPLSKLETVANLSLIKQLYKIQPEELQIGSVENAVVARIACRESL